MGDFYRPLKYNHPSYCTVHIYSKNPFYSITFLNGKILFTPCKCKPTVYGVIFKMQSLSMTWLYGGCINQLGRSVYLHVCVCCMTYICLDIYIFSPFILPGKLTENTFSFTATTWGIVSGEDEWANWKPASHKNVTPKCQPCVKRADCIRLYHYAYVRDAQPFVSPWH